MFKVVKSHTAMRCEICHKSDCYDEKNNYCSRCMQGSKQQIIDPKKLCTICHKPKEFYTNSDYCIDCSMQTELITAFESGALQISCSEYVPYHRLDTSISKKDDEDNKENNKENNEEHKEISELSLILIFFVPIIIGIGLFIFIFCIS